MLTIKKRLGNVSNDLFFWHKKIALTTAEERKSGEKSESNVVLPSRDAMHANGCCRAGQ